MKLTIIAAIAENGVIGKDNDLIWHLPNDLKHFKNLTKGHHIIMGRKTFESLPKALPHRTNIVITRQENYLAEGAIVVKNLEEALAAIENDNQPFIVGGAEIYKLALPYTHRLELTRVHGEFKGDTYFPEWDEKYWKLVAEESSQKDEKHDYAYTFLRYDRTTFSL